MLTMLCVYVWSTASEDRQPLLDNNNNNSNNNNTQNNNDEWKYCFFNKTTKNLTCVITIYSLQFSGEFQWIELDS
jgi:hypothetical protein